MADKIIDTYVSSMASNCGFFGPYWADENKGVIVYVDYILGYDEDFCFIYTDDGGSTWTKTTIQLCEVREISCWFDGETPGDSGNLLHVCYLTIDETDLEYVTIDVSTGTKGTIRTVNNSLTVAPGSPGNRSAITKTVGGNIIIAGSTQTETFAFKSSDNFATSPTSISSPFEVGDQEDWCNLYSANTTDNNDAACIFLDRSANQMSIKMYDDSADSWTETSIASMVDNFSFKHFDAAVRHSDKHILLAFHTNQFVTNNDFLAYDINPNSISSPSITAKTNILTDIAYKCSTVVIDQGTDDVYVAYTNNLKILYKKSTDDMGTWGSEQTYTESNQSMDLISGPRSIRSDANGRIQFCLINNLDLVTNLNNDIEIIRTETYSVTKSLKYAIQLTNSITKSLKYTVTAQQSDTKSLKYTVLTTPSAINKTLQYNILLTTVILSTQYTILTNTPITKNLTYTILTNTPITKNLTYTILTNTPITKNLTYHITTQQSATKSSVYCVVIDGNIIQKSLAYNIVSTTALTKSSQYIIKHIPTGYMLGLNKDTGTIMGTKKM